MFGNVLHDSRKSWQLKYVYQEHDEAHSDLLLPVYCNKTVGIS